MHDTLANNSHIGRASGIFLKWASMLAASLMAASCCMDAPGANGTSASEPVPSDVIRIGTYNVFTGAHDAPKTASVIRRMRADVVLLQELSPRGAQLLEEGLENDFPYRSFSKGVAILSRFPLRNPRYFQSERGINGFLVADIESPGGRFQVASLHLDPLHLWTSRDKWTLPTQLAWGQPAVHRAEVKQLLDAVKQGVPTVLGGDFNSARPTAINLLRKKGFSDIHSAGDGRPDSRPTLHFKLFGFSAGKRIDHILHDRSFQAVGYEIVPGRPSDHDAVVGTLFWIRASHGETHNH